MSKKLKQVVEKFIVMNIFLGTAIACGVGIFAMAKFAISAPNSAVAESVGWSGHRFWDDRRCSYTVGVTLARGLQVYAFTSLTACTSADACHPRILFVLPPRVDLGEHGLPCAVLGLVPQWAIGKRYVFLRLRLDRDFLRRTDAACRYAAPHASTRVLSECAICR